MREFVPLPLTAFKLQRTAFNLDRMKPLNAIRLGTILPLTAGALLLSAPGCAELHEPKENKMTRWQEQDWGKTADGTAVKFFTLTNAKGTVVKVTELRPDHHRSVGRRPPGQAG